MNFDEIKIKGEVKTDAATLVKYSRDASIFEITPKCVVCPKDSQDVQSLVRWVSENKQQNPDLSITARSAGTDMGGGAINDSIIMDFTSYFDRIISIENLSATPTTPSPTEVGATPPQAGGVAPRLSVPSEKVRSLSSFSKEEYPVRRGEVVGEGYAIVEPGVFYRDFEKQTLAKNLILPCYTASKSLNTVGGMAANNSAGEKSLSYGQTKDYVEELNVVLSDGKEYIFGELDNHQLEQKLKLPGFEGEIYRQIFRLIKENNQLIKKARPTTSKNSTGYLLWDVWDGARFNLAKLITGSQGTLGLVTKIKYRLVRPKLKSELLVIFMNDLGNLGEVVRAVVNHCPESFESYDDHTFKLAMKFLPDIIKKMSVGAGALPDKKISPFKLGLQFLPEVWLTITGGVPKLILIAEFTGDSEEEVYAKLLPAQKEVEAKFKLKTHVTKSPQEAEKYWVVRRESFNLLRQHTHGLSTAPFIDDIIVHPDQLPKFLPELNTILDKYPSLIYTIAGHAGDANFHIIPLMDLTKADQRMIIPRLADEVYGLVLKYNGSMAAEHNDGLIRTPFLEKMYGAEVTELFKKTKEIFDPKNIFNPRKKVGGSLEYSMAHIKRTL
jgi:FAD/FMN-containing dehydrogenase